MERELLDVFDEDETVPLPFSSEKDRVIADNVGSKRELFGTGLSVKTSWTRAMEKNPDDFNEDDLPEYVPGPSPMRLADPVVYDTIITVLEEAGFLSVAARCAGVSSDSVRDWVQRGSRGENKLLFRFWRDVQTAEANSEHNRVKNILKHEATDWHASMELLARRYPERWSKRSEQVAVVQGKVTHEVKHDLAQRVLEDPRARELARAIINQVPVVVEGELLEDPIGE